ncbi:GTPase family protein [Oceanisphaera avium]|nr:GTPase [Oceanisphaera avium]
MKKTKRLYHTLALLAGDKGASLVLVSILPVLIMMGFGVGLAFKYGYLLLLSLVMSASVAVVVISLLLAKYWAAKQKAAEPALINAQSELVSASSDWSQQELDIWQQAKHYSRELLEQDSDWSHMDQHALLLFEFIAQKYNKKPLNFSIYEGLKLLEEISHRYRLVLKEHIPAIELIKVSHVKSGYEFYEQYGELGPVLWRALKGANYAKNLVINPGKAASDFICQQFSDNLTQDVVTEIQLKAKAALLDEVAAVAINLYSQRFSIAEQDLSASPTLLSDQEHLAPELEPIRIAIIGQVSAGKSSLTNVLKEQFSVEVGVLPTTAEMTVCEAMLGEVAVKFIDLPGLDGSSATQELLLHEYVNSDLVLWLVRANQPARALDREFKHAVDTYYGQAKNMSRQAPTVICIVNQVDKLNPVNDWQPPYDLKAPHNAKAQTISQALEYNKEILAPDFTLALSISENKPHFGVEDLKLLLNEQLLKSYNVQLNRKRKRAIDKRMSFREQGHRVAKSSKRLSKSVFKHLKNKYTNSPH